VVAIIAVEHIGVRRAVEVGLCALALGACRHYLLAFWEARRIAWVRAIRSARSCCWVADCHSARDRARGDLLIACSILVHSVDSVVTLTDVIVRAGVVEVLDVSSVG